MLAELRVENLLLIERAELRLDPGLNVITGETGAGKTMLAHALDLLLGGKPRRGIVRPGAGESYVEGVFAVPRALAGDPNLAELWERVPLEEGELVLARRVTAEGRTRAYMQGRSVSARDLREVGRRLIAFYGPHEHRKLTLASAQLDVLDGFCGEDHLAARAEFGRTWGRARDLRTELETLRDRVGMRERDLDLLEFEIAEIEEAAPSEREEAELEAERSRLAGVETLRAALAAAIRAVDPEGDGGSGEETGAEGAAGLLAVAEGGLSGAHGVDAALDAISERCRGLAYEVRDLASGLREYAGSLEADPTRLELVEERLELFARLERKHGGTLAAVLEHAEQCKVEYERLSNAEETTATLERELERTSAKLDRLARKLHETRTRVAGRLAKAVRRELGQLALGDASFDIEFGKLRASQDGDALDDLGPKGGDSVEFLIAPNVGVAAGPLREIASGGELSRTMLALMSVATAGDGGATLVFDEIDAGIGGNTARTVGEKLRGLARDRQIVCITHLPQVASLAAMHFRVVKQAGGDKAGDGPRVARADVEPLERGELVAELCRMLGADAGDRAARRHAERLLEAA